jgi:hypothetical protein
MRDLLGVLLDDILLLLLIALGVMCYLDPTLKEATGVFIDAFVASISKLTGG